MDGSPAHSGGLLPPPSGPRLGAWPARLRRPRSNGACAIWRRGSSAWLKASMKSLPGNFCLPEETTDLAFGASDPKEGLRDVEQSHSRRDRPIADGL